MRCASRHAFLTIVPSLVLCHVQIAPCDIFGCRTAAHTIKHSLHLTAQLQACREGATDSTESGLLKHSRAASGLLEYSRAAKQTLHDPCQTGACCLTAEVPLGRTRWSRGRLRSSLQAARSAQSCWVSWRQPRSAATTCCWHPQVKQALMQS